MSRRANKKCYIIIVSVHESRVPPCGYPLTPYLNDVTILYVMYSFPIFLPVTTYCFLMNIRTCILRLIVITHELNIENNKYITGRKSIFYQSKKAISPSFYHIIFYYNYLPLSFYKKIFYYSVTLFCLFAC